MYKYTSKLTSEGSCWRSVDLTNASSFPPLEFYYLNLKLFGLPCRYVDVILLVLAVDVLLAQQRPCREAGHSFAA
jgi:hypothetical protein